MNAVVSVRDDRRVVNGDDLDGLMLMVNGRSMTSEGGWPIDYDRRWMVDDGWSIDDVGWWMVDR